MQQHRKVEASKEELRKKDSQLASEQERARALQLHAEALSTDIEDLCSRLQVVTCWVLVASMGVEGGCL